MSEKRKMGLKGAEALANRMIQVLKPVCQRIEVAGSIRRRKETIGDVEIVCIPNEFVSDLFGNKDYDIEAVYQALRAYDCGNQRRPEIYMRLEGGFIYFHCNPGHLGLYLSDQTPVQTLPGRLLRKSYGGYCPMVVLS